MACTAWVSFDLNWSGIGMLPAVMAMRRVPPVPDVSFAAAWSPCSAGGTLEAGYQIGCGIELGQVRLVGSIGIATSGSTLAGLLPTGVSVPMSGTVEIHPKPGTVTQVPVDKKSFKAAPVRITLKDTHVKVDGCVGQSFLRSYAVLTSSTTDTDDIVAYYGITKSV